MTAPGGGGFQGRYTLGRLLGRGGMGEVREATQQALGRSVAVKFQTVVEDGRLAELSLMRFDREARVLAGLSHPGIVTVFDHGTDEGRPYLVMELMPGGTLLERVDRAGPLNPEEGLELALALARALEYLHGQGILHRDIKPQNVLYTEGGEAKLSDFGLCRDTGRATRATAAGVPLGTPLYAAPEVLLGEEATRASDVFSLGATLYVALSGHPPHARGAGGLRELIRAKDRIPAESLGKLAPEVPPALAALLDACLLREPAARPADGAAVAVRVEAMARDASRQRLPPPESPRARAQPGNRRPAPAPAPRDVPRLVRVPAPAQTSRLAALAAAGLAAVGLAAAALLASWNQPRAADTAPAIAVRRHETRRPVTRWRATRGFRAVRVMAATAVPCALELHSDDGTGIATATTAGLEHALEVRGLDPMRGHAFRLMARFGGGETAHEGTLDLPSPAKWLEGLVRHTAAADLGDTLFGASLKSRPRETVQATVRRVQAAIPELARVSDFEDLAGELAESPRPAGDPAAATPGKAELRRIDPLRVAFVLKAIADLERIDRVAAAFGLPYPLEIRRLLGPRFWLAETTRLPGGRVQDVRLSESKSLLIIRTLSRAAAIFGGGVSPGAEEAVVEFEMPAGSRPLQAEIGLEMAGLGLESELRLELPGKPSPILAAWDPRTGPRQAELTRLFVGFPAALLPEGRFSIRIRPMGSGAFLEAAGIRLLSVSLRLGRT